MKNMIKKIVTKPIYKNKRPPQRKSKPVSYYREKSLTSYQKLVRIREADDNGYCTCITCGKKDHYTKMHGGHFITRICEPLCNEEGNVNPQCPKCNRYYFGMPLAYMRNLWHKLGGERVKYFLRIYYLWLGLDNNPSISEKKILEPKTKEYWISKKKEYDKEIERLLKERKFKDYDEVKNE